MRWSLLAVAVATVLAGCSSGADNYDATATSPAESAPATSPPDTTDDTETTPEPVPTTDQPTTTERATTTTAATTTTVAATTTTIDPIAAAGAHYIEIVTPLNCGGQLFGLVEADVFGTDNTVYADDWPDMQARLLPAYRSRGDDYVAFLEALLTYDWPDSVQPDIDALAAETSADANYYGALAAAPTFDSWLASPPAPAQSAATVVRAKLGLPSNVNTDVDFCAGLFPPATSVP